MNGAQRPQNDPPRGLLVSCMACNREPDEPMCDLCDRLEQAEEEAAARPGRALERLYGVGR